MPEEAPYWFFHANTFMEYARWAVISFACLLSACGLVVLDVETWVVALVLLGVTPAVTLLVRGRARKFYIIYMTFFWAGWFGLGFATLGWLDSVFSTEPRLGLIPPSRLPLYVAYLIISVPLRGKAMSLRTKSAGT